MKTTAFRPSSRGITISMVAGLVLAIVASLIPEKMQAQTIARRIAAARDGKVRLTFAARPDVCGSGNSISRGAGNHMNWSSDSSPDVVYGDECSHSPVRLVLAVSGGKVTKIRTYVGGTWRPAATGVTDLGAVSVRDASDYLLRLAATDDGSAGRDAILPLTLADSVTVWPSLIKLVRDENRPRAVRQQALFWVGQAASERITGPNASLANDDQATEVKKSAVFALSQRRNGEAVPALIEVARRNHDPEVRKSALFWLGQSFDPRAVSLFEEILSSR